MGQVVATNVSSLNAQRSLVKTEGTLSRSLARLASGLRINSARDDASGLQISDRLSGQIASLSVAARNASDGISLAQIAEGALGEITNIYIRMRELAVQAANGTTADGGSEKAALDAEFQALTAEATRIGGATRFGGSAVFTGVARSLQVGENSGDTISFTIATVAAVAGTLTTAAGASTAIGAVDTAIGNVGSARGGLGAIQSRLDSAIGNALGIVENASAARSRLRDADFAVETSNLTRSQILQQAGTSVLAQANAIPQSVLSLLQ